jgi:hypothetical protein
MPYSYETKYNQATEAEETFSYNGCAPASSLSTAVQTNFPWTCTKLAARLVLAPFTHHTLRSPTQVDPLSRFFWTFIMTVQGLHVLVHIHLSRGTTLPMCTGDCKEATMTAPPTAVKSW